MRLLGGTQAKASKRMVRAYYFYMKQIQFIIAAALIGFFSSCATKNKTYCINYQSIRTRYAQPTFEEPIPEEAKIAVAYTISASGELTAIVYNRTNEIMTIDQTKSFFVDTNGQSISYYDPTIRTTSTTDISSTTEGASVNLGAVANAFGVSGTLGQLASGINVGGSGTSGQSVTNATYISDQPRVSLAPNSNGAMSKVFKITAIASPEENNREIIRPLLSQENSHCRFSVCISYSFDNGETFEKLVTEFYADSYLNVPLRNEGKINEALNVIMQNKPDMYNAPWFSLWFKDRVSKGPEIKEYPATYWYAATTHTNAYSNGILYDYQ